MYVVLEVVQEQEIFPCELVFKQYQEGQSYHNQSIKRYVGKMFVYLCEEITLFYVTFS